MTIDAVRAGYRLGEYEIDLATGDRKEHQGFIHRFRQLLDFARVWWARRGGRGPDGSDRLKVSPGAGPSDRMILAIDQGTTGSTALVFNDEAGSAVAATPNSGSTSQSRVGSSTMRRDLGDQLGVAARALAGAGSAVPTSTRSGSPTSARRWLPGTGRPASRCITPWSGRTAGALPAAMS